MLAPESQGADCQLGQAECQRGWIRECRGELHCELARGAAVFTGASDDREGNTPRVEVIIGGDARHRDLAVFEGEPDRAEVRSTLGEGAVRVAHEWAGGDADGAVPASHVTGLVAEIVAEKVLVPDPVRTARLDRGVITEGIGTCVITGEDDGLLDLDDVLLVVHLVVRTSQR